MNHFKKTLTFFSLAAALILPAFFLAPQQASADSYPADIKCSTVLDAYFEPVAVSSAVTKDGALAFNYPASTNPNIQAVIETKNCVGQRLKVGIHKHYVGDFWGTSVSLFDGSEWLVPASGKIEFTIKPTEELCGSVSGYKCEFRIEAGYGAETYKSSTFSVTGATKGYVLNYNCKGNCNDDGAWKITEKNAVRVSKTCVIDSANFYTNLGPTPLDLRIAENPGLELAITETGCVGWVAKLSLKAQVGFFASITGHDDASGGNKSSFLFGPLGVTRIGLIAGESACQAGTPNCDVTTTITPSNAGVDGDPFEIKYHLKYNCAVIDKCNDQSLWMEDPSPANLDTPTNKKTMVGNAVSGAECEVTSTQFDPYTSKTGLADYELQKWDTHGWFWEDHRDTINPITLTIKTKKCAGTSIFVDIIGSTAPADVGTIKTLHNRSFEVPATESFTIKLIAGEEGCGGGSGGDADCKFNIKTSTISPTTGEVNKTHDSLDEAYGNLNYKCDTFCNTAVLWKFAGDTSAKPYPSDPLDGEDPVTLADDGSGSISPDCLGADGKAIEGCYQLYAGFADVLKGKFSNLNSIGDFINAIIALAIGIAGVITVGMIMWDGFTYWKADGAGDTAGVLRVKGVIWKRLLGLLLLFTIYTLLRTINPDLLNLTPRIDMVFVDSEEQGDRGVEPTTTSDQDVTLPTTKPKGCTEGLEKVYGFVTCKTIAPKLKALVDDAKTAGMTLAGGGFRTLTEQINLRKNNCGTDDFSIYQKKAKLCTPPTAIPGTSKHEQGLAFDFTCNGKGMINIVKRKNTEVCFTWLKANASKYGLKNLPSENWHWSIDGK